MIEGVGGIGVYLEFGHDEMRRSLDPRYGRHKGCGGQVIQYFEGAGFWPDGENDDGGSPLSPLLLDEAS